MERSKSGPEASGLLRILGGVEAGVVGGLWMLGLLVVASLWHKDPWWTALNLLGSTYYGDIALRSGPGVITIVGAASQIVATGLVGAIFAILFGRVRPERRLVFIGVFIGAAWYFISHFWIWASVNPLIPIYSPQPSTIFAHLLFGACLARVAKYVPPRAPAIQTVPAEAVQVLAPESGGEPPASEAVVSPQPPVPAEHLLISGNGDGGGGNGDGDPKPGGESSPQTSLSQTSLQQP